MSMCARGASGLDFFDVHPIACTSGSAPLRLLLLLLLLLLLFAADGLAYIEFSSSDSNGMATEQIGITH